MSEQALASKGDLWEVAVGPTHLLQITIGMSSMVNTLCCMH